MSTYMLHSQDNYHKNKQFNCNPPPPQALQCAASDFSTRENNFFVTRYKNQIAKSSDTVGEFTATVGEKKNPISTSSKIQKA